MANKASQQSPKAVGQIMDARSGEPGLDTPHTRQRLAPRFASAPQRLQAKTKMVPPAGRPYLSSDKHPSGRNKSSTLGRNVRFSKVSD
jgi:hypothetical protein